MVKAQRVTGDDAELLDPASREWDGVRAFELTLQPTPITAQPSQYIQEKWNEIPYGMASSVAVRTAHNGERLYFHLSWADDTTDEGIRDTDQFADAAAVLFPVNGDAPLQSMGSPQAPVNAWYWRPDLEEPLSISAQGTGTTRRSQDPELGASGIHSRGAWRVVIRRRLTSPVTGYVNLAPGAQFKVGFAVWQGSNQERGGLKAATLDWEPLEIEA
jgi:DMSO reductase family type II enzyme heme b subunit